MLGTLLSSLHVINSFTPHNPVKWSTAEATGQVSCPREGTTQPGNGGARICTQVILFLRLCPELLCYSGNAVSTSFIENHSKMYEFTFLNV